MKKILILAVVTLLSGCTTYAHLEKGEEKNEFFLVKTSHPLGILSFPTVQRCILDDNNKFKCKNAY